MSIFYDEANSNAMHRFACGEMKAVELRLFSLSEAAERLGMTLSKELHQLACRLKEGREVADKAFLKEQHDHHQTTLQASANMIGAAMAMADRIQS